MLSLSHLNIMKYSIEIEESNQLNFPLNSQAKITKTFPHYQETNFLQVLNSKLRLVNIPNPAKGSEENESLQKANRILQVQISHQLEWQKLKQVWRGDEYWLLVFENPISLYFALRKYKKIEKIKLEEEMSLIQTSIFVAYPDVFIYGHKESTFTNHLYSVNLVTFETKNLTPNKEYNPGNRKDYWSYFSDSRLYVYGGKDSKGKQLQQLFWTFNIQNGNWFALDMPSTLLLDSSGPFCEIQSGKVLQLTSQKQLLLVQLYQSRVNLIQDIEKMNKIQSFSRVNGLFIHKEWIYFHEAQIKPYRIQVLKSRIPK